MLNWYYSYFNKKFWLWCENSRILSGVASNKKPIPKQSIHIWYHTHDNYAAEYCLRI